MDYIDESRKKNGNFIKKRIMQRNIILFSSIIILFSAIVNSYASNEYLANPNIFADVIVTSDYSGFGVSCFDASDGSAIIIPGGGQAPYTYLWSNGITAQEGIGLHAGLYSVTITDAQMIFIVTDVIITQPPQISLTIVQTSGNSLEAIVSGGIPPYQYNWSNSEITPELFNVSNGNYSVTVSDLNLCYETASTIVVQTSTGPDWTFTVTNENHTIFIPDTLDFTINGDPAQPGDLIGIFFDSLGTQVCGGYIEWNALSTALIAYGNDPLTTAIDGFNPGEDFQWKVWDASANEEFPALPIYNTIIFPNEGLYLSNGISGLSALHGYSRQEISIPSGWSIISTYIDPFSTDVESVFNGILNDIILIKNENGELYYPPWNLNMIGNLTIGEGYEIKMADNGGLKSGFLIYVNGVRVDPTTGIELPEGWSIISYLHRDPYPIETMMESIDTAIIIVKDGDGLVYIPYPPSGPAVNTILNMNPGKGYKIKILAGNNIILHYPDSVPGVTKQIPFNKPFTEHKHFARVINTGNNHSLIFPEGSISGKFETGDEIGVFCNGKLAGSNVFSDGALVIPVFGDDEFTSQKDGPYTKDEFEIYLWNNRTNSEFLLTNIEWLEGNQQYEKDKISIVNFFNTEGFVSQEESFYIYPNPNKGIFSIDEHLFTDEIFFELTNAEGKVIYNETFRNILPSSFDFTYLEAGIYFIRINSKVNSLVKKLIIQY